jgi:Ca2+-binding RTX toxin-like protein
VTRTLLLVFAAALGLLSIAPAASAGVIVGTPGDDTLSGTDRRDFVYGRAGNDTIAGNGASDFLFGQRGDDTVSGDAGRDALWGGSGNDTLQGGGGPDALYGGRGLDVLEGGLTATSFTPPRRTACPTSSTVARGVTVRSSAWATSPSTASACGCCRRRSRVVFQRGTRGDDTLTGSEKRDFIVALAGNDTASGLGAADFLFGQKGVDTIDGDNGPDRLWGGSEGDVLHGGDGPDWLWGGGGADELFGEEGNDRLFAAADDGAVDTLDCGEHANDRDRAVLRPGDTAVNCERVRTLAS